MKLSVYEMESYSEETKALCRRAIVLLDGVLQHRVVKADEEGGTVEVEISMDDPYFETHLALRPGFWPSQTLTGKVEIRDPWGLECQS